MAVVCVEETSYDSFVDCVLVTYACSFLRFGVIVGCHDLVQPYLTLALALDTRWRCPCRHDRVRHGRCQLRKMSWTRQVHPLVEPDLDPVALPLPGLLVQCRPRQLSEASRGGRCGRSPRSGAMPHCVIGEVATRARCNPRHSLSISRSPGSACSSVSLCMRAKLAPSTRCAARESCGVARSSVGLGVWKEGAMMLYGASRQLEMPCHEPQDDARCEATRVMKSGAVAVMARAVVSLVLSFRSGAARAPLRRPSAWSPRARRSGAARAPAGLLPGASRALLGGRSGESRLPARRPLRVKYTRILIILHSCIHAGLCVCRCRGSCGGTWKFDLPMHVHTRRAAHAHAYASAYACMHLYTHIRILENKNPACSHPAAYQHVEGMGPQSQGSSAASRDMGRRLRREDLGGHWHHQPPQCDPRGGSQGYGQGRIGGAQDGPALYEDHVGVGASAGGLVGGGLVLGLQPGACGDRRRREQERARHLEGRGGLPDPEDQGFFARGPSEGAASQRCPSAAPERCSHGHQAMPMRRPRSVAGLGP